MAVQLSCGVKCSRAFLLILNIIFVCFGLVLVGFGIFVKVDKNFSTILNKLFDTTDVQGSAIKSLAMIMIIGGVITLLISAFGCMGALWKNRCFLYMYAAILGILIIVELVGFILALSYKGKLEKVYNDSLYRVFMDAYQKNITDTKSAIETLEKQFKCCGIREGISDYKLNNFTVPDSCYIPGSVPPIPYSSGCAAGIIKFLKDKLPMLAGLMGSFMLVEIFGVLSAISLGVAIANSPERYSSR